MLVISASDAAQLVPSSASIVASGFVGSGVSLSRCTASCGLYSLNAVAECDTMTGRPELLVTAVRERFEHCGQPCSLHLFIVAAVGDAKGRGLGKLAAKGLVTFGMIPLPDEGFSSCSLQDFAPSVL